jgi:hypothetical protein
MDLACRREIEDLHSFFAEWLSGRMEKTQKAFARCSDVLTSDFRIVVPRGTIVTRDELIGALHDSHGSHGDDENFDIWTEDITPCWREDTHALLTYVECQRVGGKVSRRTSSAIFCQAPHTPNGVSWRHVHETWINGHEP